MRARDNEKLPPTLKTFLATNIEGYLLEDIGTLMDRPEVYAPDYYGGCGYPLLMTVCSGIEMLGCIAEALLSDATGTPTAFNTYSGDKYFLTYWNSYVYKGQHNDARRYAGQGFYSLVRHGLEEVVGERRQRFVGRPVLSPQMVVGLRKVRTPAA